MTPPAKNHLPKIFIGSSTESKSVVDQLSEWIEDSRPIEGTTAKPVPWYDAFPVGEWTLQTLLNRCNEVDAAVFVFAEDDPATYRTESVKLPRDNVLIEYGMFLSRLGPQRVAVCTVGRPKVPTDLAGLTTIAYEPNHLRRTKREFEKWVSQLSTLPGPANPVSFDCTEADFVDRLVNCKRVTIVGVTNEGLKRHLNEAWTRRSEPWDEIKIVFLAENLHEHIRASRLIVDGLNPWDAVQSIQTFLLTEGATVARNVELRQSPLLLPFVGQLYDQKDLRVAFILPGRDIRNSCYLNLTVRVPPCAHRPQMPLPTPVRHADHERRQCRLEKPSPARCAACDWGTQGHSACRAIEDAFAQIIASTTPIYSANVIGKIVNERFQFRWLVPEHKWRHFQSCLKRTLKVKPAHLLVFLLLRHEEKVYLQYRMKENCGGEFDRYGLLPGKVNDVDFYPDGAAMQHHMEAVQKLQMTWHGLDQSAARIPREVVRQVTELAAAFRRECGLTSDAVGEAELVAACIKAARRTFREKLGADIPSDSPLIPNDGRFIVSRNDHELVIKLIVLDIDERTALRIVESNPFQRIEPKTRAEIRRLDRASKLTEFLHQNLNRVLELAFG